jgi:hypothetical protein
LIFDEFLPVIYFCLGVPHGKGHFFDVVFAVFGVF